MSKRDYSEDLLIQDPPADLLETNSAGALYSLRTRRISVRTAFSVGMTSPIYYSDAKYAGCLKDSIPDFTTKQTLAAVVRDDIARSLIQLNWDKHGLLRNGVFDSM